MPESSVTKQSLSASLKKLMKEKPFEKISIGDICEGCGMNRKSFYYHFKDKYDLMNWEFYTGFIRIVNGRKFRNGWDLLHVLVELFASDRDFYRVAVEVTGQNSFRDYFYESTMPIFRLFLRNMDVGEAPMEREIADKYIHYLSDAFLVTMYRWLNEEPEQTVEEFLEYIRMFTKGLGKALD